jgi:hypothetical protein
MGMNVLDKISARINQPDSPVEIQQARVSDGVNTARITLDINAPVEYSISFDPRSSSIFVEMPYAAWVGQKSWQGTTGSVLNGFNVENVGSTGVRLNIAVAQGAIVSDSGLLAADGAQQDRLYIDIGQK